jgi:hypothetical protein
LNRRPGFASIAEATPNYSQVAHVRLNGVASMRDICVTFDLLSLAIARWRWRINPLVSTLIPNLEAPAAQARKSSPRFADSIDPPWRINPDAMRPDGAEVRHVTHRGRKVGQERECWSHSPYAGSAKPLVRVGVLAIAPAGACPAWQAPAAFWATRRRGSRCRDRSVAYCYPMIDNSLPTAPSGCYALRIPVATRLMECGAGEEAS